MISDYLLKSIDSNKILLVDNGFNRFGEGFVDERGFIFLNESDFEENQLRCLLHESLHFHPRFIDYTNGLFKGALERDEKIESQIEGYTKKIYNYNPEIIEFIRGRLYGVKTMQLDNYKRFLSSLMKR